MLPTDNYENEEWRDVIGATGYEVSNYGRVRSWKWPIRKPSNQWVVRKELGFRILKQDKRGKQGYLYVNLAYDGIGLKKKNVNVLVLESFVGERPNNQQAAHNDGNPVNNKLNNLRWDTPAGNNADKIKHGTRQNGHRAGTAKFNPKKIKEIRNARKNGARVCDLAKQYGVCRNTITLITTKRTYKNVTN